MNLRHLLTPPHARIILIIACLLGFNSLNATVVEISKTKFDDCFKAAKEDWLQWEIELQATGNPDPQAMNRNYLTKVKVTATIGYDNKNPQGSSAADKYVFFRSNLTIAAMPVGEKRKIYFFLPGDVVKLYQLDKRPTYGYISIEVNGEELPKDKSFLIGKLSPAHLDAFMNLADSNVDTTEGMFLPITLAPTYALDKVIAKDLPVFSRKLED